MSLRNVGPVVSSKRDPNRDTSILGAPIPGAEAGSGANRDILRFRDLGRVILSMLVLGTLASCSDAEPTPNPIGPGTGTQTGGTSGQSGGAPGSGGMVAAQGGTPTTPTGGAPGANGGAPPVNGGAGGTMEPGGGQGGASGGNAPSTGGTPPGGGLPEGGQAGLGGMDNMGGGSPGAGNGGMAGGGGEGGTAAGSAGMSGGENGGAAGESGGSGGMGGDGGSGGGSVTCPSMPLKSGDTNRTVQVGGANRSYVLHVPAQYDGTKPVPLVVDFHPLGGSGPQERNGSPYPRVTDADGVIMAFPSGQSGPAGYAWNVGPCCVANVDDVGFARALVEDVQKVACIDPKRIYAVGFSMGGGMSHYLACHAADLFAAVAPAAFDLLEENVGTCKPARPITVVSFRGTGDPIVPYNGGFSSVVPDMAITFLGAKSTFEKWGQLNECSGGASPEDGQGCTKYSGCKDGVDVVLCTKQGGGHEAGNANIAWPILKQHTLP